MKKCLSVIIAITLFLSVFPLTAFAAEDTSEYDALMDLACEVFPEYAASIRNSASSRTFSSRSADELSVVYQETRRISDTESLTLAQLSSGDVIVINSSSDVTVNKYGSNITDTPETGISGRVSFKIAAYGYTFNLFDVRYTIANYYNCYFDSPGNVISSDFLSYSLYENTSTAIGYALRFGSASTHFFTFKLYFSNNQLIAEID